MKSIIRTLAAVLLASTVSRGTLMGQQTNRLSSDASSGSDLELLVSCPSFLLLSLLNSAKMETLQGRDAILAFLWAPTRIRDCTATKLLADFRHFEKLTNEELEVLAIKFDAEYTESIAFVGEIPSQGLLTFSQLGSREQFQHKSVWLQKLCNQKPQFPASLFFEWIHDQERKMSMLLEFLFEVPDRKMFFLTRHHNVLTIDTTRKFEPKGSSDNYSSMTILLSAYRREYKRRTAPIETVVVEGL